MQHNAPVKLLAYHVAQMAQALEIVRAGLAAGFDLDADDAALAAWAMKSTSMPVEVR